MKGMSHIQNILFTCQKLIFYFYTKKIATGPYPFTPQINLQVEGLKYM